MSSSGSFNYDKTRDDIINRALRIIGVLDAEGGSATSTQTTNASVALNDMVKSWNALGLLIWTRNLIAVPLLSSKSLYLLGPTTSDIVWQIKTKTTLASAAASGASSVTVTEVTGISNGNGIGVQLTTGQWDWTTVNGAPAGSVVTLTATLDSAASQYGVVMNGVKPSRVVKIRDGYISNSTGNDIPVRIIPKEEYLRFGSKTSTGTTTQVYYDPQVSLGILHLYPVANLTNATLFLEAETVLEDFDASTDNPGLPQEWLNALVWNLSSELAIEYGVGERRLQFIMSKAAETLNMAQWTSQEESVYFQPDRTTFFG